MKYIFYSLYLIFFFIVILLPYFKNLKALPVKIKTLEKKSYIIFEIIHLIGYSSLLIMFILFIISPIYSIDYLNDDNYYISMIPFILITLLGLAFKK